MIETRPTRAVLTLAAGLLSVPVLAPSPAGDTALLRETPADVRVSATDAPLRDWGWE